MKPGIRTVVRVSVLAFGALCSHECLAQLDPWEFEVYPYATTPRGMAEIETDNALVVSGHGTGGEGTAYGTFASQKMWHNAYELA